MLPWYTFHGKHQYFCYMVIRCEWQTVLNRDYNSFLLLLNILFSAKSQLVFLFSPPSLHVRFSSITNECGWCPCDHVSCEQEWWLLCTCFSFCCYNKIP